MTANSITLRSGSDNGKEIYSTMGMPTSSAYKGQWDDSRQIFMGYGIYTYPNGCEYRGYFSNGKFNGYGTLHFPEPTGISVSGVFENGKLKQLTSMQFNDGLNAHGKIRSSGIQLDEWTYCTPEDRRFYVEHKLGFMTVGPQKRLTAQDPPIQLENNTFDAGDGTYWPSKNLLLKGREPLPSIRYVHRSDEREWIEQNCRYKNADDVYMPNEHFQERIITTNWLNDDNWQKHENNCSCINRSTKEYFTRLCQGVDKSSEQISVDTILSDYMSDSSHLQYIYTHFNHEERPK